MLVEWGNTFLSSTLLFHPVFVCLALLWLTKVLAIKRAHCFNCTGIYIRDVWECKHYNTSLLSLDHSVPSILADESNRRKSISHNITIILLDVIIIGSSVWMAWSRLEKPHFYENMYQTSYCQISVKKTCVLIFNFLSLWGLNKNKWNVLPFLIQ